MLSVFQKIIFKKLVLFFGDSGAYLTLFHKGQPVKSLFVKGVEDPNIKEFSTLIRKNQKVPIYLLCDSSEQSFKEIKVPSSNPLIVKKLLQRRVKKDFNKDDIYNYFQVKKTDKSKTSQSYVLVNIAFLPPLTDWLKYLERFSNNIDAIYSLPIELQNIVEICSVKTKEKKVKKTAQPLWKMIVVQSKVGAFRIIVTKNQQIVFSRSLSFEREQLSVDNVETLKNQILGTVEFLRRIGFKDKDGICLYLMIYEELKTNYDWSSLQIYNVQYVDYNLFLKQAYPKTIPSSRLNHFDQDLSAYFVNKGKYLGFLTKNLEKISTFLNVNVGLTVASLFAAFAVVIFSLYKFHSFHNLKKDVEQLKFKQSKISSKLENVRQDTFGFDIEEDKVIDVARLHNLLKKDVSNPLDEIMRLAKIMPEHIKVNDYSWDASKDNKITLKINGNFIGNKLTYEELFSKYDAFIRDLKTEFNDFDITHSELPDTINFDVNLDNIPISFSISRALK